MASQDPLNARADEDASESDLVALARDGHEGAIRILIQRNNQGLFRVARGIVHDDAEAEDIVQEAYVRGFTSIDKFRGDAALATWLTRIAMNEAYSRVRKARPVIDPAVIEAQDSNAESKVIMFPSSYGAANPEEEASRAQVRCLLEKAIDEIPEPFRLVYILRDVQGLSTGETAERLHIPADTVKTRLHRARKNLRKSLEHTIAPSFSDVFPFDGQRCVDMADRVICELKNGDQ